MEQPRSARVAQRALAAAALAAALCAALVERRSPLAARLRDGRPWLFWLRAAEPGRPRVPELRLGVYDPVGRRLTLIRVPESARVQGRKTLGRAYLDALQATGNGDDAARAAVALAGAHIDRLSPEPPPWEGGGTIVLARAFDAEEDPEIAAARALKAESRSPRAWSRISGAALRGLSRGERGAADRLLLALELRRVPLERLEPAQLPSGPEAAPLLQRTFAPRAASDELGRPVAIEVLNATSRQGLAARAAKMLRSKGVDVLSLGAAPRPRRRTVVYDRIGVFAHAARVREALGCASAAAATRVEPLSGVDATVELGEDCAGATRPGKD